jgi:YebC/PmpR family DNA-binding regulatory protein
MPKDNIERAIARGSGADADASAFETVVYEGYGPEGVAVLVEALTDNRNRTSAEVRRAFKESGGSLGEPGSVAWLFEKRGIVTVDADRYREDELMPAIGAGAEDVARDDDVFEVLTAPEDLHAVRDALAATDVEVQSAGLTMRPTTRVEVDPNQVGALMRLLEALDDHDDVTAVHANFEADPAALERLAVA